MTKRVILWLLLLLLGATSCQQRIDNLRVAAAANTQFAMVELTKTFTAETGITTETVIGSSGKLSAQISEGAPFDVFVAADVTTPLELFTAGKTVSKPTTYAFGKLVLWTKHPNLKGEIAELSSETVQHVAIPNPQTAPYGRAALQAMETAGQTAASDKLVFGESVTQTAQFVSSGAAQLGFLPESFVRSAEYKNGRWQAVDTSFYSPIEQAVVVLNNRDTHRDEAKKFRDFLFSPTGKEILRKFGYTVPSE